MKSKKLHKAESKLEKLLCLYYKINQGNDDDIFYYEKGKDFILEQELNVSRLTVERYINILIDSNRIYVENEDEWGMYIRNHLFLSLEEICIYIKSKQESFLKSGSMSAENKRMIHLLRLIGWTDLFYQDGKVSEVEIMKYYDEPAKKRMVQRDFKILRELENIHLNIERKYLTSGNNDKQWYYIVQM